MDAAFGKPRIVRCAPAHDSLHVIAACGQSVRGSYLRRTIEEVAQHRQRGLISRKAVARGCRRTQAELSDPKGVDRLVPASLDFDRPYGVREARSDPRRDLLGTVCLVVQGARPQTPARRCVSKLNHGSNILPDCPNAAAHGVDRAGSGVSDVKRMRLIGNFDVKQTIVGECKRDVFSKSDSHRVVVRPSPRQISKRERQNARAAPLAVQAGG